MAAVQVESNHTLSLRLDSLGTSPNASVQHQKQKQNDKKKAVPRLWHLGDDFAVSALQSSWYQTLFSIQSTFFHASTDFFRKPDLDYKYLLVPLTTGSISSPMGLGSDSQPVSIQLHGEDTYLADSQQFLLEYALRYDDKVQGAYYAGTSCRGEDHDSTHLNQFCHVECELRGGFEQGMDVANRYIIYIIQELLEKHGDVIKAHVGSTKHMTDLIQLYLANGMAFPTITLDEALKLPEMADGQGIMWEYTVPGSPECGRSLKRKGEQALIARFGGAVWLVEMDHLGVPFYQAYTNETSKNKALCGDLLLGLGEVVGCGNRHTTAEQVLAALDQHAVDPAEYAWYVDMRKLKPMNTTGWGIGSERFLSWVLQHEDIRDIQLLPRLKGLTCAP